MLKTFKWIYDLGQKQERIRIAAHLQLQRSQAGLARDSVLEMMRDNNDVKKFSESRKKKLDLEIAVNHRIEEIIDGIFKPEGEWVGTSLMYPNETIGSRRG